MLSLQNTSYFAHSQGTLNVEVGWFVPLMSRLFLLAPHHLLVTVDTGLILLASTTQSSTVCTFLPWNWKYRHLIITFDCLKLQG